MKKRNEHLQALCRQYLGRLRHVAGKHGLRIQLSDIIKANRRGECAATRQEVDMLSRMVGEERIERQQVPEVLGKSYRRCVEDGDFERLDKLPRVGIYSKVSAILNRKK